MALLRLPLAFHAVVRAGISAIVNDYLTEQAAGFHFDASGSFL